jgi:hypothetical protein
MTLREVHRVIFEAELDESQAGTTEGFAVAIEPSGAVVFQIALSEARLRSYSEDRPPSCAMAPEAAVELAREILRQLAPGDLAPARRPVLRIVGSDDPEAA